MPNQMIALQARNPQLPDPARQTAQYANMMNMAKQQEAAQRQAEQAQQTMDINAAQEARAVRMAEPQFAKAQSEADSARLKYVMDYFDTSALALSKVRDPQQAMAVGQRMKQLFPEPELQASIDETLASIPQDPSQFEAWRENSLFRTMEAKDQLAQEFQKQTTGTEERIISMPKYGRGGATEVPGSRIQVAPGMTYVRGADGAIYPMPSKGVGSFGTPAPAVGGPRGNTADVVFGFGEFGSPSKPLSTLSIGEVQDFQRNTLIPNTRGKVGAGADKGTGAVGTYQITYGTLQDYAPKVLGSNWRNTPFTADVQEQIAKAIYEDVKGGDLKKTWAGLPSNRPGQYSNVPWEQVRDQIIQVESAGGPRRGAGTNVPTAAPAGATPVIPGKPKAPPLTPEVKLARDTAVQNLYDAIVNAQKKGHLTSEKQSYVANRAQEALRGRTYLPGGTAQKTSLDDIDTAATQLLRMFIQKGTSGTLNTKVEQENFMRSVGGADASYETRLKTIRNFAKQNGIPLAETAAAKPKAAAAKTPTKSSIPKDIADMYGL